MKDGACSPFLAALFFSDSKRHPSTREKLSSNTPSYLELCLPLELLCEEFSNHRQHTFHGELSF